MSAQLLRLTLILLLIGTTACDSAFARGRGGGGGGRSGGSHFGGSHFGGFAHRGHFGGFRSFPRSHVFIAGGVVLPWVGWSTYVPPFYGAPYAPAYAPTYIEQGSYWYFCPSSQTYYPYVTECPGGWQPVVPQPAPPQ